MESKTKTVATINHQSILVIQNGQKLVPIKPICEALGVNDRSQRSKIESDEILGSVGVLSTSTGKDNKSYEMFCIPYKYVFGWLFTINPKNVKEEARESVIKYRMACYDALYQHFTDTQEFLEQKQLAIEKQTLIAQEANKEFSGARIKKKDAEEKLLKVTTYSFNQWLSDNRQLNLFN